MNEFMLSAQARAKIAAKQFTQEQVHEATSTLLRDVESLSFGDTREQVRENLEDYIADGADIHCQFVDQNGNPSSPMTWCIQQCKTDIIPELLYFGVQAHPGEMLIHTALHGSDPNRRVVANNSDFIDMLRALLRYGAGHVIRAEYSQDCPCIPDEKGGMTFLTDGPGHKIHTYLSEAVDKSRDVGEVNLLDDQDIAITAVMKEMYEISLRAMRKFMSCADSESPVRDAQMTTTDLADLHVGLWHQEPQVKAALLKDVASFVKAIETLPPMIRAGYESLMRDVTADLARHTIEGPATQWSVATPTETLDR